MSDAGRQRIAEAQRKRWAALKKNKPASASAAPKHKRVLSAEGRKRIIEATKKRWAAYRKAARCKLIDLLLYGRQSDRADIAVRQCLPSHV